MILPDTSVWIDHFRGGDKSFATLFQRQDLLLHPFVIGELALGHLPQRADTLMRLQLQLQAPVVEPNDVLAFVEEHGLAGSGLAYIDVQLIASVLRMPGARLWTRDKKLRVVAERLAIASDSGN